MAILWADGFDDWNMTSGIAGEVDAYETVSTPISILPTSGRRGGGCLALNNFSATVTKLVPQSTELFLSLAFKPQYTQALGVCQWRISSTNCCTLRWNPDGSFTALSGGTGGTVLGTTALGIAPQGVFTHLQLRTVFAASGGVMQLRVNGQTSLALNVTGNTGTAGNTLVFYTNVSISSINATLYDDLVISDTSGAVANSWLGDVRVDSYLPSGNGDLSQMVGSDGNSVDNYALVNPAVPGATYAQSATVGAEDLYQVADLTHNPSTIHGVLVTASALKDDAGAKGIKLRTRSGSADAESAELMLGTSRARYGALFSVDPNTGAAWTKAGFGAAQFGVKVSA